MAETCKTMVEHVREYFPDAADLVAQIAYMFSNDPERSLNRSSDTARYARDLVDGGTFLVYYDDVDKFGRETKLLDMRLNQHHRWFQYITRLSKAICHEVNKYSMDVFQLEKMVSERCRHIRWHSDEDELWLIVCPASDFLVHKTKCEKRTCWRHKVFEDPNTEKPYEEQLELWFVLKKEA